MEDYYAQRIRDAMEESQLKALEALSGYKFWMFGYHAARWVNYSHLLDGKQKSPFTRLVALAREMLGEGE